MPGSSASISGPNVVLNTAVAESLRQYADILEKAENFEEALHELIRDVIRKHRRIIFNGNNYGREWEEEAAARGLLKLDALPDCAPYYMDEKSLQLFRIHNVYTEAEVKARYEIKLQSYSKMVKIEAQTLIEMVRRDILPAASLFSGDIADSMLTRRKAFPNMDCSYDETLIAKVSRLVSAASADTELLSSDLVRAGRVTDSLALARYCRDTIFTRMNSLRACVDELETCVSSEYWPYPTYGEILFSVQ